VNYLACAKKLTCSQLTRPYTGLAPAIDNKYLYT